METTFLIITMLGVMVVLFYILTYRPKSNTVGTSVFDSSIYTPKRRLEIYTELASILADNHRKGEKLFMCPILISMKVEGVNPFKGAMPSLPELDDQCPINRTVWFYDHEEPYQSRVNVINKAIEEVKKLI